jgi:tetratricopeptide (TPR) repeat protein
VSARKKASGNIASSQTQLLLQLPHLNDKIAQARFLAKHRHLLHTEIVHWLTRLVPEQAKVDTRSAAVVADMAVTIARKLGDKTAIAHSLRGKANAFHVSGKNQFALEYHEKARKMFVALGDKSEVARTLSASIQPLILLGKYRRAFAAAGRARRIFSAVGDEWRLARVELNLGNIFDRQDRFSEALACYERAYAYFLAHPDKDPEAVAVALHNIAGSLVGLNDFRRAVATYQEARSFALQHGMQVLVGQADYNVAWLYYLQGEYRQAIDLLRSTRETCKKTGDQYHFALCHIDLSDIYLELNLCKEAAEMAEQASSYFQQLQMNYETGRSLVNLAIAMGRQGQPTPALKLFAKARKMFVAEENLVWPSLIDLYQALVLYDEGHDAEARQRCIAAQKFFRRSNLSARLVLSQLLLARIHLRSGKSRLALLQSTAALNRLAKLELPLLNCQAQFLMAQVHVRAERSAQAYEWYQAARRTLETLRASLPGEELKTSFMKDKLEIYEGLVGLCLERGSGRAVQEEAFQYIEQSKSRNLRDLMFKVGSEFHLPSDVDSELYRRVQEIRAEINWYSHTLELEELRTNKSSPKLRQIQKEARKREHELLRLVREMPSSEAESAGLAASKSMSPEEIRATLPADGMIVEYFQVRDRFVVVLLNRDVLEMVPLGASSRVVDLLSRLQFQLSKYQLGPEYVNTFGTSLLEATQLHLKELYEELLAPVAKRLQGHHLVIVPHGILHCLPFQALFDGSKYLIDSFGISYAPSATIFSLCQTRSANKRGTALVLGIPDEAAPLILEETKAVAAAISDAQLFVGNSATADVLQGKGAHSPLIHIATHGYFRQDNPMFSGICLGNSILNLYDLYQLKLPAELITLSGCATGLNVVAAGDELLGLARGLIYAGARSALLTLWDVEDRSTSEFMTSFYRNLAGTEDKGVALKTATLELRERYPHPYYWGPFVLLGAVTPSQS